MLKMEPRDREGKEESLTALEEKRKQTKKEMQGLSAFTIDVTITLQLQYLLSAS